MCPPDEIRPLAVAWRTSPTATVFPANLGKSQIRCERLHADFNGRRLIDIGFVLDRQRLCNLPFFPFGAVCVP